MIYSKKNKSSPSLDPSHLLSLPYVVDCYCHQYSLLFPGKRRERFKIYFKVMAQAFMEAASPKSEVQI